MSSCYCGSGKSFSNCCQPFLQGSEVPGSPEALMRSRYSAFCEGEMKYIENTTDPQTRLDFDWKANEEWMRNSKFLKLEVLKSSEEGNKGLVEFKAWFQPKGGGEQVHHEVSKFRKQAGVWYFREGKVKT